MWANKLKSKITFFMAYYRFFLNLLFYGIWPLTDLWHYIQCVCMYCVLLEVFGFLLSNTAENHNVNKLNDCGITVSLNTKGHTFQLLFSQENPVALSLSNY